ncbi:hypothetical protein GE061_018988 [Apolygus lucorum]|uniref:Peptidase S1 domain-containing protein n=1 Tax=Apolygus lucorum TaxID=248454 RepID=A0A8S9XBA3_APOLU|nr:hypothetical protein GE061_018988 [Apolygus lucorum]
MKFGDPTVDFVHFGYAISALIYVFLFQQTGNGTVVSPGDYPFFTTLIWDDQAKCGATLMTSSLLFTACHCLLIDPTSSDFKYPHVLQKPEYITVEAGNDSTRPGRQKGTAKMIKVHPKCEGNASIVVYNYGLIELNEPFTLKPGYIEVVDFLSQKAAITKAIMKSDKLTCFSLEFELVQRGDAFWELGALLKEDVTMMTGDWCVNTFNDDLKSKNLHFNSNLQVCARRKTPFEDCDKLDCGGPLMCRQNGENLFIGLLSGRHHPYCGKGVPQVFARLDIAIHWMREEKDLEECGILLLIFLYLCRPAVQQTGNGTVVSPGDYPFFTTLISDDQAKCGATLMTSSLLFTACHCLLIDPTSPDFKYPHVLQKPEYITVEAGNDSTRPGRQMGTAKMIKVHPKCEGNASIVVYNYGLIELNEPFTLKPGYIEVVDFLSQKAAITKAIKKPDKLTCFSLEFELVQRGDAFWELGALVKEDMTMMTGDWCMNTFNNDLKSKNLHFDSNLQVCAKRKTPFEDCEKLDCGGPLICSQGGENVFIGLLSGRHSLYCGQGVPHVYARLDIAIDWMRDAINPDPSTSTDMPGPGPKPTSDQPRPTNNSEPTTPTKFTESPDEVPTKTSDSPSPPFRNLFFIVVSASLVSVINSYAYLYKIHEM